MRLLGLLAFIPTAAAAGLAVLPQVGVSLLDPQAGKPPVAAQAETMTEIHGDRLIDPYAWLRNEDDPAVLDYLKAENDYTDAVMAPMRPLEEQLFAEMVSRIVEDDSTYPHRNGDHWYQWLIEAGDDHWSLYQHSGGPDGPARLILDVDALADGLPYYGVVSQEVTRDGRYLAYLEDRSGGLTYDLILVDLATGTPASAPIGGVDSYAWSPDGAALYYVAIDDAARAWQVRRRVIGQDMPDAVIYSEDDPEFVVSVAPTADRRFIQLFSGASDTSEVRFVDPYAPEADPILLLPRQPGVFYGATHAGGEVVIRINDTGPNYRLVAATLADLAGGATDAAFRTLVAERPDVTLQGGTVFARYAIVEARRDGLAHLEIVDRSSGALTEVAFPEPAYTVYSRWHFEYDTDIFYYYYESQITPLSVYALDMATGISTLVQRDPVPGGFDPARYRTERIFATAADGTAIPVSIAYARDVPLDGTAPLLLDAYGAYGATYDPYFDLTMISLLDRGVIYAYAHVRGGGEYGDAWYDAGRLAAKMNTFTDVIAVAEHLVGQGYTATDRMVLTGASAGGLTVGAVINLRPDLFRAAILNVPFVDVLTAMLDPTLPLTTIEYPEWGNPEKPDAYGWMRAYDPYPNLSAQDYPDLLVLTGLGDDQVPYWQPAKYVARLRTLIGPSDLALLSVNMDAGHGGDSGRYDGYRQWALQYAFLLGVLGISN